MTLFRKVFQNQAQPATSEDAIDEDALRAAFEAPDTSEAPLVLDPFQHALKSEESDTSAEEAADAELKALAEFVDEPDPQDALEGALEHIENYAADTFTLAEEEFEDEDSPAPMDEDINAFVGRALAEDDAKLREHSPLELVDELDFDVDQSVSASVDVSDSDETAIDDEATQERDSAAFEDDTVATSDDPVEAFAKSAPSDRADDPQDEARAEETTAQEDTKMDVAAFAQQQMAALNEPEDTPVASPNTDAAPKPDVDLSDAAALAAVAAPAAGRSGRRAGRAKTRLLGFNRSAEEGNDPFGAPQEAIAAPELNKFPVGWMVIVDGPGVGHSFSIFAGASMIGRGEDQGIRLDFGDNSISRNNHAAVAYDDEENKFYIGHGGKSNIIRRNARPVLSTEELQHADLIRIGETTLRFVALCGSDFRWDNSGGDDEAGV